MKAYNYLINLKFIAVAEDGEDGIDRELVAFSIKSENLIEKNIMITMLNLCKEICSSDGAINEQPNFDNDGLNINTLIKSFTENCGAEIIGFTNVNFDAMYGIEICR